MRFRVPKTTRIILKLCKVYFISFQHCFTIFNCDKSFSFFFNDLSRGIERIAYDYAYRFSEHRCLTPGESEEFKYILYRIKYLRSLWQNKHCTVVFATVFKYEIRFCYRNNRVRKSIAYNGNVIFSVPTTPGI